MTNNYWRHLMKVHKRIALTAILLMCAAYGSIMFAQSDGAGESIAIQFDGDAINLYRVDSAGNFAPMDSLNGFYIRGVGFSSGEWEIARGSDIVLSPDRQQFAFTAASNLTRETMLFIYRVGENDFQRIAIPGLGQVIWSPDGSDILLTQPDTLFDGSYSILEEAYLYTLASNSLTLLVNGQNIALADFVWLPEGETIVYEGGLSACAVQPCTPVRDLYTIDRQRQITHQLTDLSAIIETALALDAMTFSFCDVEHPTWSMFNERLYYSLDCEDGGGFTFSTLMSVRLNGESRLEGQLASSFPGAIRAEIIDIHPSPDSDAVFLSAAVSSEEVVNGFNTIRGSWNVMGNSAPGVLNLLASRTFDDLSEAPVQASAMSPDAGYLLLGGGLLDGMTLAATGYLATVDLTTGQITEHPADKAVCDVEWVDDQIARYRQFDSACSNGFRIPIGTWLLNIANATQTEITADLNGFVWVLDIPAFTVEPVPTPTPTMIFTDTPTATASPTLTATLTPTPTFTLMPTYTLHQP
jgi:hypothetical protein